MKYFGENAPQYHVIAASSMFGITIGQGESFSVGKVNMFHMYPMDFEEVLMAAGETALCDLFHQFDYGLLACMTDIPSVQMLICDSVFKEFKDAFTESFVLQQLTAMDMTDYYWSNGNTSAEIDFVVQTDRVILIEVKAEKNVRSRSMTEYIKSHPQYDIKGLRISMLDYIGQDWMEKHTLVRIVEVL